MSRMAIFVNSTEMLETARTVVAEAKEEIRLISTHTYDETYEWGKKLTAEGTRLLIARGGHALRLRNSNLGIPIIEIPFTGNDVVAVLLRASHENNQVAVIGNQALVQIAQEMRSFMDAGVSYSVVTDWRDFETEIAKYKERGIKAIIGGYDATHFAKAHGMTSYCITTNVFEIRSAIADAQEVLDISDREKRWNDLFRTVLNKINEGVILVNRNDIITHINAQAERFLGNYKVGSKITDPVYAQRLHNVFANGNSILDELTEDNDYKYSCSIIPIFAGSHITDAVIVLQEIEYVRKVEQKARQQVSKKGLIATRHFENILGNSIQTRESICTAKRYALVNSTILITGDSGTGKEVYAQSIHNYSLRKDKPFVAVNCATIPPNLLESELFGYAEGAFTGAKKGGKAGLFELAHEGTIFLDEIGETSLEMQARLLRVLEEHQIMRVGDDRVIPVNIRVIAATNKDLQKMVQEGTFRQDFYYRLNVLSLN